MQISLPKRLPPAAAAALTLMLAATAPAAADETQAREILKAMSDYLASLQAFGFDYDSTLEVVTTDGQKLALASSGAVEVERPDRVHATRSAGFADVEIFFDGKEVSVVGKRADAFARAEIPGSIDHLIDELRTTYGFPLPAADLLESNPYDRLMEGVTDVKDLGSGVIGGIECDHLAFRAEEVDWQIWITQGENPRPCRYSIATKSMPAMPEYVVDFRDWRTGDAAKGGPFSFEAPAGAKEIDMKALGKIVSDLPENFTIGGGK